MIGSLLHSPLRLRFFFFSFGDVKIVVIQKLQLKNKVDTNSFNREQGLYVLKHVDFHNNPWGQSPVQEYISNVMIIV